MPRSGIPAKTGDSRVFLIKGRAGPTHNPDYQTHARAGAPSQSFGDVEKIESPSPVRRSQFVEIGEIQGAVERGTSSIVGRYLADLESELLTLARQRCPYDVMIVFGACTDPRRHDQYTKILFLEDSRTTTWESDDMGALESGENAAINETSSLSYADQFEILQLATVERGGDNVTNPVVDVTRCDRPECGDCDEESDGCEHIYAVTLASPGSPGTAPDLVYTLDKGVNWANDDIDSMLSSEDANAVACLNGYVVVVSEDSESHHYKLQSDVDAGVAHNWTEEATGYVSGNGPLDIWSPDGRMAFIVGENGYIYSTEDATSGVVVVDAGVATSNNLNAVHALSEKFAVAVGDSDTIVWTQDGVTWQTATATGGGNNLLAVWIIDEDRWWTGDDGGNLYFTLDGGVTWIQQGATVASHALPVTLSQINDIQFPNPTVGFIAAETSTPRGVILRSIDGGHLWRVVPEGSGTIPNSDSFDALATCPYDVNFFVTGGLADDASDGILVVGND